jgi:hypothetical protein
MSWQAIASDKEKYQAYLCSREWGLLRESVRKRSGGKCERCLVNDMDHVHHLTYERKYEERLNDLQALCRACHEFTHGRSHRDPAALRPVYIFGCPIRSFYLAGKITKTKWRDEIVPEWSFENSKQGLWRHAVGDSGTRWRRVVAASESVSGVFLDYVGPWWRWTGGGGHADAGDTHSPHLWCATDNHGLPWGCTDEEKQDSMIEVAKLVRNAVSEADMIFAWIDSDDCLGTMLEIGMASSLRKPIVVASPEGFDTRETWLARHFACCDMKADSAGDAWRRFWQNSERRPTKQTISSRRAK